jgi:NADPH:quinone reductase-like Zn-dependent oxidoreductase
MDTMKALQLTRTSPSIPPSLNTAELPIPQLKQGYALVQIQYAFIQPSDKLNAQGSFPSTTFPRVLGRDYSGTVIDILSENAESKSWIGKQVYGTSGSSLGFDMDGTHAQYCLIPENALVEKPTQLSSIQAATVGVPFTTAMICLQRAQAKADDVVLVTGASGAVGSAVVQIARAMGCKKVLTAARRGNPDVSLTGDTSIEETISTLTGGKGVDVVVDTVGDLALMAVLVEQLAVQGRYAWITGPRGGNTQLAFDVLKAYRKEISLVGCNSVARTLEQTAEYLRSMNSWIEEGLLKAQDEAQFEKVNIDDAIASGYGKSAQKVVIDMS